LVAAALFTAKFLKLLFLENDMTEKNPSRARVIEQIGEQREQLVANLKPFWMATCEDLIAGGVPREKVGESIFGASITLAVQIMGFANCAAHLRDMAALVERAGLQSVDAPPTSPVRH
jgi:hypothetical protein